MCPTCADSVQELRRCWHITLHRMSGLTSAKFLQTWPRLLTSFEAGCAHDRDISTGQGSFSILEFQFLRRATAHHVYSHFTYISQAKTLPKVTELSVNCQSMGWSNWILIKFKLISEIVYLIHRLEANMSVSIQLIPNYVECRGVNTDCNIPELWEFPTLSDYLHLFTLNQHWIDTAGALLCLCPAFCLTNLAAHLKATKQGTKSNDVGEIWRNWMKLDERWWKRGRIRTSYGKASKPQSICQLWHFSLFISHHLPDLGFVPPTEHRVHVVADLLWLASALALRP